MSISWSDMSSLYLSGMSFLLYSFSKPSAIHARGFRSFSFISSGFIRLPMLSSTGPRFLTDPFPPILWRSEEHTSELQSQSNLVCRLLLEKKKKMHTDDVLLMYHDDICFSRL